MTKQLTVQRKRELAERAILLLQSPSDVFGKPLELIRHYLTPDFSEHSDAEDALNQLESEITDLVYAITELLQDHSLGLLYREMQRS